MCSPQANVHNLAGRKAFAMATVSRCLPIGGVEAAVAPGHDDGALIGSPHAGPGADPSGAAGLDGADPALGGAVPALGGADLPLGGADPCRWLLYPMVAHSHCGRYLGSCLCRVEAAVYDIVCLFVCLYVCLCVVVCLCVLCVLGRVSLSACGLLAA